jgi:hypothetical protein
VFKRSVVYINIFDAGVSESPNETWHEVIFINPAVRKERGRFWALVLLSCSNRLLACMPLCGICRALAMDVDFLKGLIVFLFAIFSNVFGIAGGLGLGTLGFDFLLGLSLLYARLLGLPLFLWHNNASADQAPLNHGIEAIA